MPDITDGGSFFRLDHAALGKILGEFGLKAAAWIVELYVNKTLSTYEHLDDVTGTKAFIFPVSLFMVLKEEPQFKTQFDNNGLGCLTPWTPPPPNNSPGVQLQFGLGGR